jgi:ATP-dependent Clp protease ATP-binding subunit ClpA
MFERFTERARQVVVYAQDESRRLRHNYIGTEHLLLGLLREEEGLAAKVLDSFGLTLDRVRDQVARIVGRGDEIVSGQIPFTPRGKKVLELSLREALSLGHDYIGTEHILLGLVRENEGVAMRIMLDYDAYADTVRADLLRLLAGPGGQRLEYEPQEEKPVELTSPPISPEVLEEIARVGDAKQRAIEAQDFGEAARLRNRQRHLQLRAAELQRVWEEE